MVQFCFKLSEFSSDPVHFHSYSEKKKQDERKAEEKEEKNELGSVQRITVF